LLSQTKAPHTAGVKVGDAALPAELRANPAQRSSLRPKGSFLEKRNPWSVTVQRRGEKCTSPFHPDAVDLNRQKQGVFSVKYVSPCNPKPKVSIVDLNFLG